MPGSQWEFGVGLGPWGCLGPSVPPPGAENETDQMRAEGNDRDRQEPPASWGHSHA